MAFVVQVDKDLCISSGKCVADAPDAFVFDDDELAEARPPAISLERQRLLAIARNCPGAAITVMNADGDVLAP